jgi:WD40 repeat protein
MARRGSTLGLSLGVAACLAALVCAEVWTRPERRAAYAIAFAPRGDQVAAVTEGESKKGQLWVWDVATGRQITSATGPDRLLSLAFTPDGTAVATGGWNGTVNLWNPATGRILRSFSGHSTPVRGLAFLPDGRMLAAGASDGRVILWDVASGREQMRLDRGSRLPVNGMAITHDGRFLAAAGGLGAGAVSLWDVETARSLIPASLDAAGEPIAFAPGRAVLAARATSPAGSLGLVDLDGDLAISTIAIGGVRSLAFSPDGRLVAIGDDDEAVTVREAGTGRSVATFDGHRHRPDTLGDDIRRFMATAGLAEPRLRNTIWSVAFSPDGTRLASAGQDGSAWLWGLPGRDGVRPLDRALLPRRSRPNWLGFFQVILAFAALGLLVLAAARPRDSDFQSYR